MHRQVRRFMLMFMVGMSLINHSLISEQSQLEVQFTHDWDQDVICSDTHEIIEYYDEVTMNIKNDQIRYFAYYLSKNNEDILIKKSDQYPQLTLNSCDVIKVLREVQLTDDVDDLDFKLIVINTDDEMASILGTGGLFGLTRIFQNGQLDLSVSPQAKIDEALINLSTHYHQIKHFEVDLSDDESLQRDIDQLHVYLEIAMRIVENPYGYLEFYMTQVETQICLYYETLLHHSACEDDETSSPPPSDKEEDKKDQEHISPPQVSKPIIEVQEDAVSHQSDDIDKQFIPPQTGLKSTLWAYSALNLSGLFLVLLNKDK